ncbi:hypothetical protein PUR49_10905 [Streptomyces sp. BE147]|uniref:hypothetical protein n=1 Tax=Streptomyces sp. BE147 TaxID=3002524 RepID=UPI002E793CF7|nr:hypothetical protein [Streptomyces sp. BE147]MEE1737007.1 hypothetical protein [Streptomyces sp. BE147]
MTDQAASDFARLLDEADIRGARAAVLDTAQPALWSPMIAVWTDRAGVNCPQCFQPVRQDMTDHCPVPLDQGELRLLDQTHHCGQWLDVTYAEVRGTGDGGEITVADIERTARTLAERLSDERAHLRDRRTTRLRRELQAALVRLAEPLGEGETTDDREEEVSTGTDVEPGVFREHGDEWQAWDCDPVELHETLAVYEEDLRPS